jgi:DNA-binding NarL/FixJ family response regulator
MSAAQRPTVVIAEDHQLVADGLVRLLEEHCVIRESVRTAAALRRAAREHQPDILVMDITLGDEDSTEVFRELHAQGLPSRGVFLTMHSEPSYLQRAVQAGGIGFVLKTSAAGDLRAAVLAAAENRGFVSGYSPEELAKAISGEQGSGDPAPGGLTSRQKEVLRLLARGLSARAAGEVLGISQRTVEYHKNQMMQLAGVTTTTALVMWGVRTGIIQAGAH